MGNSKPNYYSILTADVRYNPRLSAQAKLFYAEITALCNATGVCTAGNNYFARLYELKPRQVQYIIKSLEDEGVIEVVRMANKRQIRLTHSNTEGEKDCTLRVQKTAPEGAMDCTHNNIYNNIKNNNSTPKRYSESFEKAYAAYPNKHNKEQTYRNYQKAVKEGYSEEQLLNAVNNYARHCIAENVDKQFIVRSSNFFGLRAEYKEWLNVSASETLSIMPPTAPQDDLGLDWSRIYADEEGEDEQ